MDFLPRLPAAPLTVGTTWADTLHATSTGPAGEHVYSVVRRYHVTRAADAAKAGDAVIVAEGEVRYRSGWWVDEAKGVAVWVDVRGPLREEIVFNPSAGGIVQRTWEMDLRGTGGLPRGAGGTRLVPAGLRSASRERRITRSEAAGLQRDPQQALRAP